MDKNKLLAVWLATSLILDLFLCGLTSYAVFILGHSGWWFLLTLAGIQVTMFKALGKTFDVD